MKIFLACPAPPGSRAGNRVTALRWARLLQGLGHRVAIRQGWQGESCDLLVALHARRSASSIRDYRRQQPQGPLVVALTGTDLYRDIHRSRAAQQSLEWADRLVVLQPLAAQDLPPHLRGKVRVLYQSALSTPVQPPKGNNEFDICVVGHLRPVKDPFRTALALRRLPDLTQVRVLHVGRALSPAMAVRARAAARQDARYHWLGEVPRWRARRLVARSQLVVLSSRLEGGANVISEAVVDGVPVLASRIPGSVGLLGAGYPGYFPVGDTQALADLLRRTVADPSFHARLRRWCVHLRPRFEPAREQAAWQRLLGELVPAPQVACRRRRQDR